MFCECGCGGKAPIAKRNRKRLKYIKDKPMRFINGHNRRDPQEKQIFKFNDRWWIKSRCDGNVPWAHVIYSNNFLAGKEIPKGFEVHHKNRICDDDRPENLQILTKAEHRQLHFGKSVILKGYGKIKSFESAVEAARWLGLSNRAVSTAIHRGSKIAGWDPSYFSCSLIGTAHF